MNVRIKICGITSVEDALGAEAAGADAIGLVLYEKSPRNISIGKAREIRQAMGPFTTVVALLVNSQREFIERVIDEVAPDLLQFHGDETPQFCREITHPYIRAIRVREGESPQEIAADYTDARAILFDAWSPDAYGGTGTTFDWSLLDGDTIRPWILAGGLTPENVSDAVKTTQPYAVDVSGGVETSPGVKDVEKIQKFIRNARRID